MNESMERNPSRTNTAGAIWQRWDPHIHAPGTVLNNQFPTGEAGWEAFIQQLEASSPVIKALGITDYYSFEQYQKVAEYKEQGRLPNVDLIFPNIEMRFDLGTGRDTAINGHLLVSPEDPNHIEELRRFLNELTFQSEGERYRCTKSDLIRLGRAHDKTVASDEQALATGTNQFKVNFDNLISAVDASPWAQQNILLAVSANTGDGTSGLAKDASFSAVRRKFEAASHIIFAGQDKQRDYWLGKGVVPRDQLISTYRSCKPCLHGSDAHSIDKVGKPDLNRYCWIKGDITFDALRQICIEPEHRVIVGEAPPSGAIPSNIISSVSIGNADLWMKPSTLQLNSGLVAIIGARGSGKTALADLIAVGGKAISSQLTARSFISRARGYLVDTDVTLEWANGTKDVIDVEGQFGTFSEEYPNVQYLSQQFVDKLCSSEGIADELLLEIERVIFQAHPSQDRLGMGDFNQLLGSRTGQVREERAAQQLLISSSSELLIAEREKKLKLPSLKKAVDDKKKIIEADIKSRNELIVKEKDIHVQQLAATSAALDTVRTKLENAQRKLQQLTDLQHSVQRSRENVFPDLEQKLKSKFPLAGLPATSWEAFKVDFVGDVNGILSTSIAEANSEVQRLRGTKPAMDEKTQRISLIPSGANLELQSFELLTDEVERLKKLIGIDTEKGKQYTRLTEKITKEELTVQNLLREIVDCEKADANILVLREKRKAAYQSVIKSISEEEEILKKLYEPLESNLSGQVGSLAKLSFRVEREVDLGAWAARGENLMDLRKSGAFRGRGALFEKADAALRQAWTNGTSEETANALAKFIAENEVTIQEHCPYDRSDHENYYRWFIEVSSWLYSTEHISNGYGVQYDGVNIQQLSPGTRGIVLLLLYLAIDREDDRPLIIDQPEENLDPKSIYDELVHLFREVKTRRQIIIVTHNANLVVNTDADQVIVANCGSHQAGRLPEITYTCGGLENPEIRNDVCKILEGGEDAFRERAKRLRVKWR